MTDSHFIHFVPFFSPFIIYFSVGPVLVVHLSFMCTQVYSCPLLPSITSNLGSLQFFPLLPAPDLNSIHKDILYRHVEYHRSSLLVSTEIPLTCTPDMSHHCHCLPRKFSYMFLILLLPRFLPLPFPRPIAEFLNLSTKNKHVSKSYCRIP